MIKRNLNAMKANQEVRKDKFSRATSISARRTTFQF